MIDFDARVVYTSLHNTLDSREMVRDAFHFWRNGLAKKEFDAVAITEAIDSYLGLADSERKKLMLGLFANAGHELSDLAEIPEYIENYDAQSPEPQSRERETVEPRGSSKPAMVQAVESFLLLSADSMRNRKLADRQDVVDELEEKGLPSLSLSINQALQRSVRGVPDLPASMSLDDCLELMHQHYLLLCDVVGPVDTDLVYQDSITTMLKADFAKEFDPRQLLP